MLDHNNLQGRSNNSTNNKWNLVAEILGVKIDEEFDIDTNLGEEHIIKDCKITYKGLVDDCNNSLPQVLFLLISDKFKIIKK